MAARHPDWVVGFVDEVWWSRLAQPALHTWTADRPLRLVAGTSTQQDVYPKAVASDGMWRTETQGIWLRFVNWRPISQATIGFLKWVTGRLAAEGQAVAVLIWDNASWHISKGVRDWERAFNLRAKRRGTLRLVIERLPIKCPWLNPIVLTVSERQ